MIERFLKQTKFTSEQDFKEHLEFIIPVLATFKLAPGDVVAVTLRFSTREYNGQVFQDILLTDFYKFN